MLNERSTREKMHDLRNRFELRRILRGCQSRHEKAQRGLELEQLHTLRTVLERVRAARQE